MPVRVEYDENGKVIPDGYVTVTVSAELAAIWDPTETVPRQDYRFDFKDMVSRMHKPHGLQINFPRDGERPEMLIIPWAQVLAYEVRLNSPEVADALLEEVRQEIEGVGR